MWINVSYRVIITKTTIKLTSEDKNTINKTPIFKIAVTYRICQMNINYNYILFISEQQWGFNLKSMYRGCYNIPSFLPVVVLIVLIDSWEANGSRRSMLLLRSTRAVIGGTWSAKVLLDTIIQKLNQCIFKQMFWVKLLVFLFDSTSWRVGLNSSVRGRRLMWHLKTFIFMFGISLWWHQVSSVPWCWNSTLPESYLPYLLCSLVCCSRVLGWRWF